ncbi:MULTISPECIES: hypothetical protein [unclassified Pseudoalteromonas]|uniref:phage tail terminator protein n=1 Tax=unclassified Pseudoalteromonas TaxID=194690 RepID=UPI000CF65404|nr:MULTISPECIES: hypothetical protein [unclassified Pseudoalteromonas]MBS3796676.1 hypothetical protein [Pseudoalteromonas sp. BDTF-M6]
MEFNFDLKRVETLLKEANFARVGFASDFNQARKTPVQSPCLYVIGIDDNNEETTAITGEDEYRVNDIFAVMIVIPCLAANATTDQQIKELRNQVKATLAGVAFLPWEPIKLNRSRIVELNRETNNLIYQCQFSVKGTLTVKTKVIT